MESLKINTGVVHLQIEDPDGTPRGVFSFNPDDVGLAKRLLALHEELITKTEEFEAESKNVKSKLAYADFLDEIVTYFTNAIDEAFGVGSSLVLFGGAKSVTMFDDFFEGIMPYFKKASDRRKAKYGVK